MIFLGDKCKTGEYLSNPSSFLSQRAIARRNRSAIPITLEDIPVCPDYLTQLNSRVKKVYYTSKWFNGVLVSASADQLSQVESLPFVDSIEYVAPGEIGSSNTRKSFSTSSSRTTQEIVDLQRSILGIDQMHEDGYRGEGILIAVMDSGFPRVNDHPAYAHLNDENRVLDTYSFISNQESVFSGDTHGTDVLSFLAAVSDDYIGIAPDASYLLYSTENAGRTYEYRVEEYNWLFAAERADSAGADIINTSLSYTTFSDPTMDYTIDDLDGQTSVITRASNIAFSKGMITVASAGNEGNKSWDRVAMPADAPNNISVGAINENEVRASFSSIGPTADNRIKPDLMAIGLETVGVAPNGNLKSYSGTSFSSPQIAGLAAGIWQAYPGISNMTLVRMLRESGDRGASPDLFYGYGVPTYQQIRSNIEKSALENPFLVYPNPTQDVLNVGVLNTGMENEIITFRIFDRTGRELKSGEIQYNNFANTVTFDLADFKAGLYVLYLFSESSTYSYNIIKQ